MSAILDRYATGSKIESQANAILRLQSQRANLTLYRCRKSSSFDF